MEITVDYLMSVLEETDTFAMRPVNLGLTDVDDFSVLEEFRSIEGRLHTQDQRRAILDNQKLLKSQFNVPQFSSNEGGLVVEVI